MPTSGFRQFALINEEEFTMFNCFGLPVLKDNVARKWLMSAGLAVALAGACVPGAQAVAVVAVTASQSSSCAITGEGAVMCWGANAYGQLGNNTTLASAQPVNVIGLTSGISAITSGSFHTCALTTGGTVKCWGDGANGQLGNNSFTSSSKPVDVAGLTGVVAISGGYLHTCALTATSTVKCWGNGINGQLGNGTTTNASLPVDV